GPSISDGRGEVFVKMLAAMIRRYPVTPVIGGGMQRLQPIPVEQVATGFARAVGLEATGKHIYPVGGPDAVTMLRLVDLIGAAVGRPRVRKIHVPLGFTRTLAPLFHRLPGFPRTPDQLLMLEEDNVCDPEPFVSTFGLTPVPLVTGLRAMLS